ncbi:hypothetical protein C2845_PM03G14940 [Panicum miliaceum]|uniref:Uncharacterized protein n=1 Tax=Panicum miliaceum TaxID=4540 RepID=A0A3L6T8E3_PANMI|nr:hypothetical protein C2845_PM03G14940 [Panicum miliaceum]
MPHHAREHRGHHGSPRRDSSGNFLSTPFSYGRGLTGENAPSRSEELPALRRGLTGAGHPMLRPGHEVCITSRCDEMDAEEARLKLALLAAAPDGSGHDVLADQVLRAVRDLPGIAGHVVSIRKFFPEKFLIVFTTQADRDCAFRGHPTVLRFRVSVELEGIPAHAASLRTAQKILSSSCWIERLAPSSEDKSDQLVLKLTAWTDNPSRIPRSVSLLIAEYERLATYDDPVVQVVFGNLPPYLRRKDVSPIRSSSTSGTPRTSVRARRQLPAPHRLPATVMGMTATRIAATANPAETVAPCYMGSPAIPALWMDPTRLRRTPKQQEYD